MSKQPIGFMSYVRFDNEHDEGQLTEFCKRLAGEVRIQTGEKFEIFQDLKDITWGQQWAERLDDSIDGSTFLIPIITPGLFKSAACRKELDRFLLREKARGRADLILPVYYVDCPAMSRPNKKDPDSLAQVIASRNYYDWRELRFEPFTKPEMRRALADMAKQIVQAMEREPEQLENVVAPASEIGTQDPPEPKNDADGAQIVLKNQKRSSPPKSHVVDSFHRGDFLSISEALCAASPGDRILVRPGLYREGLVIDKPIEIIGEGELGEVVIEAENKNAVRFMASMGRIANLTLRQTGDSRLFCIDIGQGRLDIEDCDISGHNLSCIGIHDGADPRLRRNRIHNSLQSGVLIYKNGFGTLEDNEIFDNAASGVVMREQANPTLRRNRIHDCGQYGIYGQECRGVIEDNEIFSHGKSALLIRSGANPFVRRNRIYEAKGSGIFIHDGGLGVIEDNEIFKNALAGIAVDNLSNPVVRRCNVHSNIEGGIMVYDKGIGVYEENLIVGNGLAGLEVRSGAAPLFRRNTIRDGKQGGIYVHNRGKGRLEGNHIIGNDHSGILIAGFSSPIVSGNEIVSNKIYGIKVMTKGRGDFQKNDLRGNGKGSWDIPQDCLAAVKRKDNLVD
ncbi:right-handed parallel beta-helix repeat-containing protein [Pseudomonas monsensis]